MGAKKKSSSSSSPSSSENNNKDDHKDENEDSYTDENENGINFDNSSNNLDNIVIQELKSLYTNKLLPIEKKYLFHNFNSSEILDSELSAKPTVLLIGQYSTGKTTFIRHLIGMDYPEMHIGPEPTTDRFIAVVHGNDVKTIQGNAVTGVNDLPFSGLSTFGSSFLNKFNAAVVPASLLENITIIDTPGVLSGEKQRTSRGYDFSKVARWFAERSDLILLLFDCSKLDISDEFKSVIEELQPFEDKVQCVLNKADQLDQVSLMRVYGALLWSMGRIFKGAEVSRIFVGSFHDEPLQRIEHEALFEKDKQALMSQLNQLPKACSMRKINEMVKRIRKTVVHVCILGHLRSKMPYLWGKEKQQLYLIENLQQIFNEVKRLYRLADGDFPKIDEYKVALDLHDFYKFPLVDRKDLILLNDVLNKEIPRITALVAGISKKNKKRKSSSSSSTNRQNQTMLFTLNEKKIILSSSHVLILSLLVIIIGVIVAVILNRDSVIIDQYIKNFQEIVKFYTTKIE